MLKVKKTLTTGFDGMYRVRSIPCHADYRPRLAGFRNCVGWGVPCDVAVNASASASQSLQKPTNIQPELRMQQDVVVTRAGQ